jgi:hypothetical protein
MKIALCFSGHLRNFNYAIDNIIENIINPLKNNDENTIDIFISTWDKNGLRSNNWQGDINYINEIENKLKPKIIDIENENRNYFIENYSSQQYKKFKLCSSDTCSNASSMWYKVYKSFQLVEKYSKENNINYDILVRIRPDVIYHNKLDYKTFINNFQNETIILPEWHGKYEEINHQIMDQFAIGKYEIMKKYFNTFENILEFIKTDNVIHCGEGFLYGTIQKYNINIKKYKISYSIIRKIIDNKLILDKMV